MSYTFNTYVNNSEASALKEMIFNRVRERSQSMTEDLQSDVMDMARQSFVSNDNPFSQIIANSYKKSDDTKEVMSVSPATENKETVEVKQAEKEEIGFPKRELKTRAFEQTKMVQAQLTSGAIMNNMEEARDGLKSRTGFMGALDFLNSQAAVSLMRTRAEIGRASCRERV